MTAARWRKPSPVGIDVMSATHSWSGAAIENRRWTRSGAVTAAFAGGRGIGTTRRRRWTPTRPSSRIRRATRLRPTRRPCARNVAWTRGAPYVPREAEWISRISVSSATSMIALDDGCLDVHARYPLGETPSTRHRVRRWNEPFMRSTKRYAVTVSARPPDR